VVAHEGATRQFFNLKSQITTLLLELELTGVMREEANFQQSYVSTIFEA
jgi:hypothetical protein